MSHVQASNQILANVRVLDFGRYVADPDCATLLGYMAPDVVRIEKTGGSEDRYFAPVAASGEGGVFLQTACNKRSICIDSVPPGRARSWPDWLQAPTSSSPISLRRCCSASASTTRACARSGATLSWRARVRSAIAARTPAKAVSMASEPVTGCRPHHPPTCSRPRDGHPLTHVVGNGLFRRWAGLIGEEDKWNSDPRFATDQLRGDYREVTCKRMALWCAARTTDEAVSQLNTAGLPADAVVAPQQAIDNSEVTAMDLLQEVVFPGLVRLAPVAGLPLHFLRSPTGIRSASPRLGEHSDAILRELGCGDDKRIRPRESGIVA